MSFTDDDLKRFNEMPRTWPDGRHFNHEDIADLSALLARLDAADLYIRKQREDADCLELFYEAYLKSRGEKDNPDGLDYLRKEVKK